MTQPKICTEFKLPDKPQAPPVGQTPGPEAPEEGGQAGGGSPGAPPPAVSAAPHGTHHIEVGEHIALRVPLVSLVDVGAHGHQQPQVQDGWGAALQERGRAAWPGRKRQGEMEGSRKLANCGFSHLVSRPDGPHGPHGQACLPPCAPGLADTAVESCLGHLPLGELVGPSPSFLVGNVGGQEDTCLLGTW